VMLAAQGTTRNLMAAALTSTTRGQVEVDRNVKNLDIMRWLSFISQATLLKFNECTYGANIYNSEFSAAVLCSRRCCPHLRFLSQFFPFNTSHLPFLDIHSHYHWATCWPVTITTTSKILFCGLKGRIYRVKGLSPQVQN
jgi:hypothetical protein